MSGSSDFYKSIKLSVCYVFVLHYLLFLECNLIYFNFHLYLLVIFLFMYLLLHFFYIFFILSIISDVIFFSCDAFNLISFLCIFLYICSYIYLFLFTYLSYTILWCLFLTNSIRRGGGGESLPVLRQWITHQPACEEKESWEHTLKAIGQIW